MDKNSFALALLIRYRMKIAFYLKTCSTNKKIMSVLDLSDWELREIKSQPITAEELEILYQRTQSYEALFSKKSSQIKTQGIDVKSLNEEGYRCLILEHYSFLKRPVFITDEDIFIGNDKANVERLHERFGK